MHFRVYLVWIHILLAHGLVVMKKLVPFSGPWSFVRHIELRMAVILVLGSKIIFLKYSHVIYHSITNLMLIENRIRKGVGGGGGGKIVPERSYKSLFDMLLFLLQKFPSPTLSITWDASITQMHYKHAIYIDSNNINYQFWHFQNNLEFCTVIKSNVYEKTIFAMLLVY